MLIRECTRDEVSFTKMLDLYVTLARQASDRTPGTAEKELFTTIPKNEQKSQEANDASRPFIGVIDDSASLNEIVKRVLEHEGFRVNCWQSAIDLLEGQYEIPHLILLDIEMPDLNGAVAMDRFKADARFARTKIIFMTGLVGKQEAEELSLPGKTAYLSKPFTKDKLINLVRKSLG